MTRRVIHWFRQDLRLSDNPALFNACKAGKVLPVFIYDAVSLPELGHRSKWWLYHSLQSLNHSLDGRLKIFEGDTQDIFLDIIKKYNPNQVFWNKVYSPDNLALDSKLLRILKASNIQHEIYNGTLLWDPEKILNQDHSPYKVFTPFYKKACSYPDSPELPVGMPDIHVIDDVFDGIDVDDLDLLSQEQISDRLHASWLIGEAHARRQLNNFVSNSLPNYKHGRDFPSLPNVSRLSPYLHFGEISPNYVWHEVLNVNRFTDFNAEKFLTELSWREFAHYLLYHFPDLPSKNLQHKFDKFPWSNNYKYLELWKQGMTGYPIIDAGMRELIQTGYMHNRLRMIVGSFLVKNLLQHWHLGRDWFWNLLVDADIANNSAGWQWVAGCGSDAAPYFRVFNPVLQGKKFDPNGEYIRRYIPELREVPSEYIFTPWEAPNSVLGHSGVVLGKDYPFPIVDLKESRVQALEAFDNLKIDK
tara:strand:- start:10006 stop:11421 length:1416 start_codon:yes stop_codon:yes gene_type:complete